MSNILIKGEDLFGEGCRKCFITYAWYMIFLSCVHITVWFALILIMNTRISHAVLYFILVKCNIQANMNVLPPCSAWGIVSEEMSFFLHKLLIKFRETVITFRELETGALLLEWVLKNIISIRSCCRKLRVIWRD